MSDLRLDYQASAADAGQRADKVLAASTQAVSRVRLKKAFDAGGVTVNGVAVSARHKLQSGDRVAALIASEVHSSDAPSAQAIALDVLYEDEHLIAVNKPSGMVTHPGNGTADDTLVHALLAHCGAALSSIGAPVRPGIVHRLDKETSGVIVVAKSDSAHLALARAFAGRELDKRYCALVRGAPTAPLGSCKGPIFRHPVQRTKMAVLEKGRVAHTDWRVLQRFGSSGVASMIECVLHTGRTHQIRVHLSHAGFPLLGDTLYGFKAGGFPIAIPRVMLHAERLRLKHPLTQEPLELSAPLPMDFEQVIVQLETMA
jgi:23S rRNA pseudouridine1911/1915/1917 synthase